MARARNRDAVLKTLRKALDEDRTKTFVVEISPLGLVEMTRQNVTEGVREIMTRPCPTCDGEGVIKSEETIAIEFERRMRDLAKTTEAEALLMQMNPRVSVEFTGNDARVLHAVEAETGKWFHFEGSEGLPLEHFAVLMEARPREGARACAAVPRGRGGLRRDRRAAHVQRRATRSPRSTATSSPSRTPRAPSARSGSSASRRSAGPRRSRG